MIALRYLQGICQEDDIVLLHDAVRPLVTEKMITDNIASVREFGNGITAVPFTETAITSDDGKEIRSTIIRNTMYVAKAPQSFYFKDVLWAHEKGQSMPESISIDTCTLMTTLGKKLYFVPCESTNIKITTPDDYYIFKALYDLRESQEILGL